MAAGCEGARAENRRPACRIRRPPFQVRPPYALLGPGNQASPWIVPRRRDDYGQAPCPPHQACCSCPACSATTGSGATRWRRCEAGSNAGWRMPRWTTAWPPWPPGPWPRRRPASAWLPCPWAATWPSRSSARRRERVDRLALFDTSARPDTAEQARRRRGLIGLTRTGLFKGVTPRLLPQLLHPDNMARPVAAEVTAMAERVGRDAFLRQQAAILGRADSRPDLPGIRVPTLVAVGEQDVLTPPDHAEEMAAGIPDAVLHRIPGCGHLPPMEFPGGDRGAAAALAGQLVRQAAHRFRPRRRLGRAGAGRAGGLAMRRRRQAAVPAARRALARRPPGSGRPGPAPACRHWGRGSGVPPRARRRQAGPAPARQRPATAAGARGGWRGAWAAASWHAGLSPRGFGASLRQGVQNHVQDRTPQHPRRHGGPAAGHAAPGCAPRPGRCRSACSAT